MNVQFVSLIVCFLNVFFSRHSLETISSLTSAIRGSGMDGGLGSIKALGGGSFAVKVCQGFSCCSTGSLNTEDDNWEVGQVDWFVGRQIGSCSGAMFNMENPLKLTLMHQGGNAGRLEWMKVTATQQHAGWCGIHQGECWTHVQALEPSNQQGPYSSCD